MKRLGITNYKPCIGDLSKGGINCITLFQMIAEFRQYANWGQRDHNGKTPYDLALENGHVDVANMIADFRKRHFLKCMYTKLFIVGLIIKYRGLFTRNTKDLYS